MDLLNIPMREADTQFQNERSRTVKIFLMKYKCILLLTFLLLALAQMVYIMLDKLVSDEQFMTQLFAFLHARHEERNLTQTAWNFTHPADPASR
jgi:uncharacterized membrane protein YqjE